jgi:hypothetical protein
MESKSYMRSRAALPPKFRLIGGLLLICICLVIVLVKVLDLDLDPKQREQFRFFSSNGIILSLFFVAWSADKVEDELTVLIRLRSAGLAFAWGILNIILSPATDLIFTGQLKEQSGQQIILSMLLFFMIMNFFLKRSR